MKDNRCFVCKYREENRIGSSNDSLFDGKGNEVKITLCYNHSVELFKAGQKKFIARHKDMFSDKLGLESDIDIIESWSA